MTDRIYLDHAATTPLRTEVADAMSPYLGQIFGNPSSLYAEGQAARRAIDTAREQVASALGARFGEVTFTSGGTEADNAALVGVMAANRGRGRHLVTTTIEHEAVLKTCAFLELLDFDVTYVDPGRDGRIDPTTVEAALRPDTILVSVMHANNEIGTIQPIREIVEIAHRRRALVHTDAVQSFAQLAVDVGALGVDLLSVSAHKIYGPKGVGALYCRQGIPIEPFLHGGSQERERRAGTESVAGIVGFGAAADLLVGERSQTAAAMIILRDRMIDRIQERFPEGRINGHLTERLPNNVNVSFPGRDAETVLLGLDLAGVAASSGSACTSGSIEPSHVLRALGLTDEEIGATIRFTLGRASTEQDVDTAVDRLATVLEGGL